MTAQWLTGPNRTHTRFGEVAHFKEGLYRLSERCYSWMVPNGSWGETNIGLIDCDGQSVLIDTCWDLNFTREMLAGASQIIQNSPIEYVVNTHSDGDHCWGNQLFPDSEIIASDACIHHMHHTTPFALRQLGLSCQLLKSLPFSEVNKFTHYMSAMIAPYDFKKIKIVPANQSFSGSKVFSVNGVEIILTEVGPAHTNGDTIVYIPSQRIVYAADILFINATPVLWAGPVDNIIQSLKLLLNYDASIFVPGHGPLCSHRDIQLLIDYWLYIQEALYIRFQRDMPPFEAARDIVMGSAFQQTPFAMWDSPERIVTNAFNLYQHWGAKLSSLPGNLGILNIMRLQAKLAELYLNLVYGARQTLGSYLYLFNSVFEFDA